MEIDHLESDEIEVECLVRGLNLDNLVQLKAQLVLEIKSPALKTKRPHMAAYKNPKRELQLCGAKLNELKEWIQENSEEVVTAEIVKIKSRILHIQGRLERMTYSKSLKKDLPNFVNKVSDLLRVIGDKETNETHSLTVSIREIRDLDLELESDDEVLSNDFLDPQMDSTKISRKNVKIVENTAVSNRMGSPGTVETELNRNRQQINISPVAGTSTGSNVQVDRTGQTNVCSRNALKNSVRELLGKESVDSLIDIVNDMILTKTANMSDTSRLADLPTPTVPCGSGSQSNLFNKGYGSNPTTNQNAVSNNLVGNTFTFDSTRPPPAVDREAFPSDLNMSLGYSLPYLSMFVNRDPSTWGITFTGNPKDPPIESFIFRVEATAKNVFHISEEQLVNEFGALLKNEAQEWYWSYMQRKGGRANVSYRQLKNDIIARYRDRRSDYELKYQLSSRKQNYREKEEFRKFYDEMLILSTRLRKPIPDDEFLEMVKRNMRPGLQIALVNRHFNNLEQLMSHCVALETMWSRHGYQPEMYIQNRRFINEIEGYVHELSEGACFPNQNVPLYDVNALNGRNVNDTGEKNNSIPQAIHNSGNSMVICWNCCDIGHGYQKCPKAPMHIFCHGCGTPDVYLPDCAKCRPSSSGNVNLGTRNMGRAHLQKNQMTQNLIPNSISNSRGPVTQGPNIQNQRF